MKKSVALFLAFVAVLWASPARAADYVLFNNVAANAVSVPDVIQTGDPWCEVKITGTGSAVGTITLYHGSEKSAGVIVDQAIWFQVSNPLPNDPNNHLFGACPNFVGGTLTNYGGGTFRVTLRTKR